MNRFLGNFNYGDVMMYKLPPEVYMDEFNGANIRKEYGDGFVSYVCDEKGWYYNVVYGNDF